MLVFRTGVLDMTTVLAHYFRLRDIDIGRTTFFAICFVWFLTRPITGTTHILFVDRCLQSIEMTFWILQDIFFTSSVAIGAFHYPPLPSSTSPSCRPDSSFPSNCTGSESTTSQSVTIASVETPICFVSDSSINMDSSILWTALTL